MKKRRQTAETKNTTAPFVAQGAGAPGGPLPWLQVAPFFLVIAALASVASVMVLARVFNVGEARLVIGILLGTFVASRWLAQPYTRSRPIMSGTVWVISQVVLVGLLYLTLP